MKTKKATAIRKKRPALRLGTIDAAQLLDRLRELHELGGDPEFEKFPDTDELFLVLRHVERMAAGLRQPANVPGSLIGEAAVLRVKLWQHLREQADIGQLKALEDGRAAGVTWHHFAEALAVASKQGAYQKARRLKAEQVRAPGERRTPEVAREHERRAAAEERAERTRVAEQERRFPLALRIGRLLLEHRDGLVVSGMSAYWLEEIADTIDDRTTATERANFTTFVESLVRHIHQHARDRDQPPTTTAGARNALALATEFTHQEWPTIPER
ncbi:hypothetical protein [Streptomyces spongiae]|uniref:Uncharacterized protein n=1 Tax=Streptomyces spongiae TaxID=565072 RepID=A0A5N8XIA0_9ACTN|nr:hypothetical protein [Streptomyces spongiae]MPY58806.1 hypothetical protein [Streptomyces spongiae]